jgi:hypothetical protein
MLRNYKQETAIVVLGGGLTKENNKWRTTAFSDKGDNFGICGGRLRVVAASLLYKKRVGRLIISSGGKGQLKNIPNVPAVSIVVKNELIDLGVPAEKIIEENSSDNTFQQLLGFNKIINKNNLGKIIIISNKFHLPRLQAMIKCNSKLFGLKRMIDNSKLELKSAEEILLKYEPDIWRKIIEKAYKSKEMKERVELENKGICQIKDGTYKFI